MRATEKIRSTRFARILMISVLAAFAACDDEIGDPIPVPGRDAVARVEVRPEPVTLVLGDTVRFAATPRSTAGDILTGREITWTTEDTAVATVAANGLVTARRVGSVLISATVEGKVGSSRVTVYEPLPEPVARVEVTPALATVATSEMVQLATAAFAANDSVLHRSFTWTSSNHAVALVDQSGLVLAVAPGNATITATSEGKSDDAVVLVTAAASAPVLTALSPDSVPATGEQITIRITGSGFSPASTVFFRTSSVPRTYVSPTEMEFTVWPGDVARNGLYAVKVSNGPATGFSNTLQLKVSGITRVVVAGDGTLWTGEAGYVHASGMDWEGNIYPPLPATYTSSNTAVLTVEADGRIRGVSAGSATITATMAGRTGTWLVRVLTPPPFDLLYEAAAADDNIPELWLMSPGAMAAPRRILPARTYARTPAASADGSMIAFSGGDGEIHVVSRNGTGLRRVTSSGTRKDQPAWSPDGTRILYRAENPNGVETEIGVVNVDGTGEQLLTWPRENVIQLAQERPTWTPNGSRIVFARAWLSFSPVRSHLVSMNADGSDPKRLTDTPNSDTEPAYAPNGTLAIRRTWYQPALGRQITLLDESGNALPVFNPRPEGHKPAWSPDGVWLAYIGAGLFGDETGLVVTLPGHPQGKLIAGHAENPVWIRR